MQHIRAILLPVPTSTCILRLNPTRYLGHFYTLLNEDNGTYAIVYRFHPYLPNNGKLINAWLFCGDVAPLKDKCGCVSFKWQNVKTRP